MKEMKYLTIVHERKKIMLNIDNILYVIKVGKTAEIHLVFCKCKFLKFADKNGEFCISVLEKVAGCPAGLPDAS